MSLTLTKIERTALTWYTDLWFRAALSPKEFDFDRAAGASVWNLFGARYFNGVVAMTTALRMDVTWSNPIRPKSIHSANLEHEILVRINRISDFEMCLNPQFCFDLDVQGAWIKTFSRRLPEHSREVGHTPLEMTASTLNRSSKVNHVFSLPHL